MPVLEILVVPDDGEPVIVNGGRPACLMAFEEKWKHTAPEDYTEIAWLAHRALKIDAPLKEWIETIDECTMNPVEVEIARAKMAGDEMSSDEALSIVAEKRGVDREVVRAALRGEDALTPPVGHPTGDG